ncbi:hypothetical protein ERJ75_000346100 [Trypanosoma vivax]|nr:hypothetical protein ERJ75_000346100 [Trypanosoma vivax]
MRPAGLTWRKTRRTRVTTEIGRRERRGRALMSRVPRQRASQGQSRLSFNTQHTARRVTRRAHAIVAGAVPRATAARRSSFDTHADVAPCAWEPCPAVRATCDAYSPNAARAVASSA